MKNTQTKSFTFKVAQQTEVKTEQVKAREGVAMAGCTLVPIGPWGGREPRANDWRTGTRDGGYWC